MSPRKKMTLLSFVQSGNLEISSQIVFEPRTLRVTVGSGHSKKDYGGKKTTVKWIKSYKIYAREKKKYG